VTTAKHERLKKSAAVAFFLSVFFVTLNVNDYLHDYSFYSKLVMLDSNGLEGNGTFSA
jgi:hypothetical protein